MVSALITLPVGADREGIARVLHLEKLVRDSVAGLRATIPAYNRLLIEGSPDVWDPEEVAARVLPGIAACLQAEPRIPEVDPVTLPVCYDPKLGPDLEVTAARVGCSVRDIARRHSTPTYLVLATGFAPGWAYLGDIDEDLAVPRRATPRRRVPAGTVAIADRRTGVYPTTGPGGWRLLGRVPEAYFQNVGERVGRFRVGGAVRFRPISLREFQRA